MRENIPVLKSAVDRLKGPCYLSGGEHDCKIRARKQRTNIGMYCFLNRTITMGNQMPAEAQASYHISLYVGKVKGF